VVSAHSVLATWTDNSSDETLFRLEARVAGGGWTLVATAPASSTSATIEGLAPATTYELRVQARNAHGGSPFSNVATVTTRLPVPGAPTGLAAEVTSATAVRLSWTPPAGGGQSLYRIESRTPWSPVWLVAGEAPPAATDLSLGGLDPGVPVTFRVRAVNGQGASEPSSTASVTPFAPLAACTPGEHALCLGDRFEVRAHWSSYNGGSGVGGAAAFPGGESGTFWFFKPSNIELIVKLLDGRNLNDHFWVFHGALTDVEYWISVVDTATGNSRTYYNEPRDICGQFDTRGLPGTGPATAAAPRGAATSGPEELSLMGGRFRVEVAWADHRNLGRAGTGRAVVGSDQSGYFWFFKPSNIELVVKVMDGRKVNDRFWVFFGSLSDVEYDITVTDTDTGQAKSYHNAGGSTCGQFDTAAFPF
jgi:hypothetical protein